MNPKYRMRKLFYDKHDVTAGKEDLLCLAGEGVEPLLLTEKQNLGGNIKQVIKYVWNCLDKKNYQSILK